MSAFKSVRKYLSLLSILFVLVVLSHLIAVYLFEGSQVAPERGGAVSVGFIGAPPSLGSAQFRKDPSADFVLRFLYRSLLRYDIDSQTMQGDLANCDLGKNFSEIRCFFKGEAKWSDGTPITKDDVLATYALFSETETNKRLQSALAKTTVEDSGDAIVFKTQNPNVDLLDVFTVPIISTKTAEAVREGTYRPESGPFSGPYVFEKRETEDVKWVERMVLGQNIEYAPLPYVSKYIFRFFPDKESLLAAKDTLNLIYPSHAVGVVSSPRFANLNLSLPEYVGLFANAARMPQELRALTLSLIGNAKLEGTSGRSVKNPFFTDESIVPSPETKNPEELFGKLGYFKKAMLETNAEKTVRSETAPKISADTNRYFQSPSDKKMFVGWDAEDVLISGWVPEGVSEVYVNSYRLQGFVPKSGKFYYRAKIAIGTMKEGTNEYILSFVENGVKTKKETLTIEFVRDVAEREKRRSEVETQLSEARKEYQAATEGTAEKITEAKQKYAALDNTTYYDISGKPLSLTLKYVRVSGEIPTMAEKIAKLLKESGILVSIEEIPTSRFEEVVKEGKKDYDFLLTGVNLGLLGYNVFPFFHSGQAETGFNFSKLKNPSLDVLLEELKSKDLGEDGLKNVREKILAILRKEAVTLTFSNPYIPYSVDRNVKGVEIVETLPATSYVFDMLEKAYVRESRLADFRNKSLSHFLEWIKGLLGMFE